MLRRILLDADPPAEPGNGNPPDPAPAPTPAPAPGAPPAAAGVINGKTENEVNLERQLAEERERTKKAQTDAAYLADENRRLKETTKPPEKKSSGWYFPDEE